jgi:tetratricopeptide (TPR) repeat protein/tRNA A-37 threonylcarbamoyl transferase component Bud32
MPAASPCPQPEELRRLLCSEVEPWEVERLIGHLEECIPCSEVLDRLLEGDGLVAATAAPPTVPAGESEGETVRRLMARLRRLPQEGPAHVSGAETPPRRALDSTTGFDAPQAAEARDFLAPPQEPDEIGRLGSYGVLRVLGRGGMGIVFQARQTRPQRLVALKMILAGRRAGREQLLRFRSEAEVVARLQHPNIVQIHEVGEHDGRAYYAMEFVPGGSLAERLAAAPLAAPAAARLVQGLAEAVQHAHERGIVHRDLKPSNVLLLGGLGSPSEWVPKIADFGLAKQFEGEGGVCPWAPRTESGAILGTPGYMAPEQAGSGEVGPAADVYALGAILYECLTSRPPFRAATVLETLEQVRSQEPVAPGRLQLGLPRDLQTICLKCLRKEPARRYVSARELADDLGRFLRGEPIRARPAGRAERLWKWARRKPALAALVAVSGLSLAALVAGGWVYNARLRAAVAQAEAKEEEARQQHALAVNNFRAARESMDRMLERVEYPPAGVGTHSEELRGELLKEVLAFYERAHGADDPDPGVRRDMAYALARIGATQHWLGRNGPAAENFRRAIALLEGLPPEQRALPLWRDRMAECWTHLGGLAAAAGQLDEAERACRQVLAIHQQLVEADPENPYRQNLLADAERGLGKVCQDLSRWAEAEAHYNRARDLRTRLLAAHPAYPLDEIIRMGLGSDHVLLGHLDRLTHRPAAAGAAFAKAEELLAPLVEAHPDNTHYVLSLTNLDFTWAGFLQEQGRFEAARRHAGRAVDLAEGVLRRDPHHVVARAHARESHLKRALACESLSLWAEAVPDWDRVVELDDQPDAWQRRVRRALALARVGEHARAAAAAQALADKPEIDADGLWKLAVAWARSVPAARSDSRLSAAERDALAERYAGRAVALLRKLRGVGRFQDVENARQLRTGPDLQPLHGRADFQELLK